ncbi:olfactory receptor 5AR1-like [Ambystoma mexicanum]|uniref:olfactory receptor 5AR1-like n=1 Tax=Ambystoma mexicanum TaxID=8296 RepID=UPI0037E8B5E5
MKQGNWTLVTEFILLGLTNDPEMQTPLFAFFLLVYILTLVGNIGMIALIRVSPRLHTPMYFLLSNLSFVDFCYSSVITPNMLANFLSAGRVISLPHCATQLFFFLGLGSAEICLLAVMAYDRYVAICNPLLYSLIMAEQACFNFVAGVYLVALLHSLLHTTCTFQLPFCLSNRISHFYCDIPPLLKLSCSDTSINEALLISVGGSLSAASLIAIIISYTYIALSILRIRSLGGKWRAFSTCSSHFVCITLFFSTGLFMYVRPTSSYSMDQDKVASVFYTVVIPMLNPFIYSLRNSDVKGALRKVIEGGLVSR